MGKSYTTLYCCRSLFFLLLRPAPLAIAVTRLTEEYIAAIGATKTGWR